MRHCYISIVVKRADACYDHRMKKRTYTAVCQSEYLMAFGLDPDRVIYFDIETTGFRPSTSSLYMIGWAVQSGCQPCCEDGPASWSVTQIMAQSRREEVMLLRQFADILKDYDTIIEFNGDRFDLPYLREKYLSYDMHDPLSRFATVDLYRQIRPYRQALGLARLNQKSVERFLEIQRSDPYSGGELIDVYRTVRDHRCDSPDDEEKAVSALFLHNREDVTGMMDMTPLLAYRMAVESSATVTGSVRGIWPVSGKPDEGQCDSGKPDAEQRIYGKPDADHCVSGRSASGSPMSGTACIIAFYKLDVPVPKSFAASMDGCCEVNVSGSLVRVVIRPFCGCMYHFFPDYKNYYYLPEEDTAMHKSVASFVDPAHREKAKAQNCYVKREGVFLPSLSESESHPVFRRSFTDPVKWFEYKPHMENDSSFFGNYIHNLVRSLCST